MHRSFVNTSSKLTAGAKRTVCLCFQRVPYESGEKKIFTYSFKLYLPLLSQQQIEASLLYWPQFDHHISWYQMRQLNNINIHHLEGEL
jgi:hypothetical protein